MRDFSKEEKIWLSIFFILLIFMILFFLPIEDGYFGEFATITDIMNGYVDISSLFFWIEVSFLICVCYLGYSIHSNYNSSSNNFETNLKDDSKNMNSKNTDNENNILDNNVSNHSINYTDHSNMDANNNNSSNFNNNTIDKNYLRSKIDYNTLANNKFALYSFICGIVSYFLTIFAPFLGIASIILGVIGISSFDECFEKNKWMSVIGIILGIFCILRQMILFN